MQPQYHFGFITINLAFLVMLIGIVVGMYVFTRQTQKARIDSTVILKHFVLFLISGLIGSRLIHVLFSWPEYFGAQARPWFEIIFPFDLGFSAYGALIGMIITLMIILKIKGKALFEWLDAVTIPFLVALGIANIGMFLEGTRNYGRPTDLFFGVLMPNSKYATEIYPTQLFASGYMLLIAYVIYQLQRKSLSSFYKKPGIIFFVGLSLFSAFRFIEEFFRGDERYITIFEFPIAYYLAGLAFLGSSIYLISQHKRFNT